MDIKREIKLTARTVTEEGKVITNYEGSVNTDDPKALSYRPVIVNQTLYKEHREKVKKEQEEFENTLYEEQAKMIAQLEEAAE